MAELVTLADVKSFLRIDHAEQDLLLTSLAATATEHALELANGLDVTSSDPVPERVRTAILIHVLALFDNPEASAPPKAAEALLHPFRKFEG